MEQSTADGGTVVMVALRESAINIPQNNQPLIASFTLALTCLDRCPFNSSIDGSIHLIAGGKRLGRGRGRGGDRDRDRGRQAGS